MPEQGLKPELSLGERDRRYSLLQEKLKKAGLSALMVYGGSQLGVPVIDTLGQGVSSLIPLIREYIGKA